MADTPISVGTPLRRGPIGERGNSRETVHWTTTLARIQHLYFRERSILDSLSSSLASRDSPQVERRLGNLHLFHNEDGLVSLQNLIPTDDPPYDVFFSHSRWIRDIGDRNESDYGPVVGAFWSTLYGGANLDRTG